MIVLPHVVAQKVLCECGGEMRPVEYRPINYERTWIFWRCETNADHITGMVPRA